MVAREVLYDDMDNTAGAERITVSINGRSWELDLATANHERFDQALKPFLDVARPIGRHPKSKVTGPTPAEVRAWCAANDVRVAPKGRVPDDVLSRYLAAQA